MTNYSINKFNHKFEKNKRVEGKEGTNEYQEQGHKRSLKWFLKYVDSLGSDGSLLWREIKAIVLKTVCSIQPILKHYYSSLRSNDYWSGCCFQVLGFDIMVSDRMKPYILEVNSSPSFGTDSQLDEEVKSGLVRDTFKIINFSTKRKVKIIKEERLKLSKRMFTGKRERITPKKRLAMKCKWIKRAEQEMVKETGGLAGFEKVFGVDEYVDFMEKEGVQGVKMNQSFSQILIAPGSRGKGKQFGLKKRASLTVDRFEKLKNLKRSDSSPKELKSRILINQGNCLGVENRHKVFDFMQYAELFEKKAHVSKSKRSKLDSILIEDLKLMTQNDENDLTKAKLNSTTRLKKPLLGRKLKPIKSITKLDSSRSQSIRPKLKKYKSCALLGPKPQLKVYKENETFNKLFHLQFYDRKQFLKIENLCPMIKLVFDLIKFLIDFELRFDVSSRLKILRDFRWKRICFCRLCSYLTKIEKNHRFVFIKLKHF